ncbi:hypothetical protein JCM6882_004237 [Rhodosporidiobolus microsporus]
MSAASKADAPTKKRKEGRTVTCSYCDMSFKKLEHLQRHERTHTLDRPYACDSCGKTFARQDTLHRHSRLHARKEDDAPNPKSGKKRRPSNASSPPPRSNSEGSPSASSGSSSSNVAISQPVPPSSSQATASFSPLGLSMSLPVAPPSFPAYTQPEFRSIDPSVIPLARRFSDAGHGASFPAALCGTGSSTATAFAGQVAGTGTGTSGAGPPPQRPALLGSRPRALTLAGLPESLGCFSLVNSPAPSDAEDSEGSSSENDDDEDGDAKISSSTSESDANAIAWVDPFPPPESHYPSPAFSEYSPSALHTDTLTDLQAILDNDPVPAAFHRPSPPPSSQPEFDFEAFAASIEGPSPSKPAEAPPLIPSTLEELLGSTGPALLVDGGKGAAGVSDAQRYPTPPSGTLAPASISSGAEPSPALPSFDVVSTAATFDLQAELSALNSRAHAEQQAREAAATAALFGGFGMSVPPASAPTSATTAASALGLSFGLPTPSPSFFPPVSKYHPPPPPQRGLSLPISAASTAAQVAALSVPPSSAVANVSPQTPQTQFPSLSATYTTTYPSLSLPVAGFDLPNSTSATSNAPLPAVLSALAPAMPAPSTNVQATVSPASTNANAHSATTTNIHELLTTAWENRNRTSSSSSPSFSAGPLASLSFAPGSLAMPPLKSPFAHPAVKSSTPAFYIPSSSSSSSAPVTTMEPSTASLSAKLSLPVANWLA